MTKPRRRQAGEGTISAYKVKSRLSREAYRVATGTKADDDGTRYLIKYTIELENGEKKAVLRRRSRDNKPFLTRSAAAMELGDILSEVRRGEHVLPQTKTLGEWLDEWLDTLRLAQSTEASYRKNVRLHLKPALGGIQLQRLTGSKITAAYKAMEAGGRQDHREGEGLSPRTVRYIHTILKSALKEAVQQGLISRNPADTAKPPTVTQAKAPEMHPWTAGQLKAFLDWAWQTNPQHAPAWHVAAYTGVRRGELLGLTWADVDLKAARLSIRRSAGIVKRMSQGKVLVIGPTKGKRARTINIDPRTVKVLKKWRRERGKISLDLVRDDAPVFGTLEGATSHPERFSARFVEKQAQCRRAKSKLEMEGPPAIRFHDLRHTHATLLLKAGVPVKVVSERLGHATVTITLETYAHVMPGMQAEAAATFARLMGGAS